MEQIKAGCLEQAVEEYEKLSNHWAGHIERESEHTERQQAFKDVISTGLAARHAAATS